MRPSLPILIAALIAVILNPHAHARSFRPARIPNGTVSNCSNCHVNPGGGGTRTPFGQAVFTAIGGVGTNVAFWDAALAALDSDGDGITNGQELLDPDGDGIPTGNVGVTNPGNRPPVFTSSPVASAAMGLAYSYAATALDAEANAFTYTKETGPAWLAVGTGGGVTGTPPVSSAGTYPVSIRVTDTGTSTRGFSRGSNTQSYSLTVVSSYAGWQNLNFTLPAEAALAPSSADPDRDGLPNLLEYALRLPPRAVSPPAFSSTIRDGAGRLLLTLDVRDDDPKLSVVMEAADDLTFAGITTVSPGITDPISGDGLMQYRFLDAVLPANAPSRFVRIRVTLLP